MSDDDTSITSAVEVTSTAKVSPKREINEKATLAGIRERQERLSQIKERRKIENNHKLSTGLQVLYNSLKNQNQYLLEEIEEVFKMNLPYNCDLKPEFVKPPYITPKIVSHKIERHMNSII
jgi:hypothetical protein